MAARPARRRPQASGGAGLAAALLGLLLGAGAAQAQPAATPDPVLPAVREAVAALFQVQGAWLDGRPINELLSTGFLWPQVDCPGRYGLTVRHGVNAATPGAGGDPVFSFDSPLGARVRWQMARREGQPPARGEAEVIAVGQIMGSHQDWALLRLDTAQPGRALPPERLAGQAPRKGQPLRLLGLPADVAKPGPEPRAVLEAPCATGEHDAPFGGWRSSCRGAAGQSGGPMLYGPLRQAQAADGPAADPDDPAQWRIGGMVVSRREAPGGPRAVFLSLHGLQDTLEAAIAADRAQRDCRLDAQPAPPSAAEALQAPDRP